MGQKLGTTVICS